MTFLLGKRYQMTSKEESALEIAARCVAQSGRAANVWIISKPVDLDC